MNTVDAQAAALFGQHADRIRVFADYRLPGHGDDIVQETFVRAIQHLRSGKPITEPRGFLFTTARNLITSMYRKRAFHQTNAVPDIEQIAVSELFSPERKARSDEKLDRLCKIIAKLPDRHQEAFVRLRVWGQARREIAETMQISEEGVSNYATLAWRMIQESLEAER